MQRGGGEIDLPPWLRGKECTCSAGETGSIPGCRRSFGERNDNISNFLAWEITWIKESGRLQSMASQRLRHD